MSNLSIVMAMERREWPKRLLRRAEREHAPQADAYRSWRHLWTRHYRIWCPCGWKGDDVRDQTFEDMAHLFTAEDFVMAEMQQHIASVIAGYRKGR